MLILIEYVPKLPLGFYFLAQFCCMIIVQQTIAIDIEQETNVDGDSFKSPKKPDHSPFPDIFYSIFERKSIRYLYEVNTNYMMPEGEIKSILVEEIYSFELGIGKLKYYDGLADRSFYWYDQTGERIWTKPFTCLMENIADRSYVGTTIFNSWFEGFERLLVHNHAVGENFNTFYGVLGLMANARDLKLTRNSDVLLFQIEGVKKHGRCWTADLAMSNNNKASLRFIFELTGEQVDLSKILTDNDAVRTSVRLAYETARLAPLIKFSAQKAEKESGSGTKLVITVLRVEYDKVTPSDLALPEGYGCYRDDRKGATSRPLLSYGYPCLTYDMEATLTIPKEQKQPDPDASDINAQWYDYDRYDDNEIKTHYSTMSFKLIDDTLWKTMTILYEYSSNYNISISNQAHLVSWDLNSLIRSDVNLAKQDCTQRSESNNSDGFRITLEFPDTSRLILVDDARRIMAYYDRDFVPHLVNEFDLSKIRLFGSDSRFGLSSIKSDWYLMSYETKNMANIMLYARGKLLNPSVNSFVRKILYNKKTMEAIPLSVDIYFYNDITRTKRDAHLHINIMSIGSLDHWAKPNNLVDLSPCFLNRPRRSAKVSIEFPLNDGHPNIKDVLKPHLYIRRSIANYFRDVFNLHATRISSIDVSIEHDHLVANVHLLDKPSFHLFNKKMPPKTQEDSFQLEFTKIQSRASFTTMTNDAIQCGTFCESYKCKYYIFCPHNQNCLLLHSSTTSNSTKGQQKQNNDDDIGSFYDVGQTCVAYEISSDIYDKSRGWSLEDILTELDKFSPSSTTRVPDELPGQDEDLVELHENTRDVLRSENRNFPVINMVMKSQIIGDTSAIITMVANKISHSWDNSGVGLNKIDSGPTVFEASEQYSNKVGQSIKFRVIASNRRFRATSTNQFTADDIVDGNLDNNGGFSVMRTQDYYECAQMCSNDYLCFSFSYCHSDEECVLSYTSNFEEIKSNKNEITQVDQHCSIIGRNFLDMFRRSATKLSPDECSSLKKKITLNVENVLDCAAACINSIDYKCLSFDFCSVLSAEGYNCVLYEKHYVTKDNIHDHIEDIDNLDDNNGDTKILISANSTGNQPRVRTEVLFCTHHSRTFLVDFNKIHKKRMPLSMIGMTMTNEGFKQFSNEDETEPEVLVNQETQGQPTIERCARLCEEDQNCGAFEYCLAIRKSSGEHFSSCSVGNNRTLELIGAFTPTETSDNESSRTLKRSKQKEAMSLLVESDLCSVYAYSRLSLVISSRKKNMQMVVDELVGEKIAKNKWWLNARAIFRVDIFIFFIALTIGIVFGRKHDYAALAKRLYQDYQRSLATPDDGYSDVIVNDDIDYNQSMPEPSNIKVTNLGDRDKEANDTKFAFVPSHDHPGPSGFRTNILTIEEQRKASITSLKDSISRESGADELIENIDDNQL